MNYGITVIWKGNDKTVLHGPNIPLRTQIQFFNDAVRKRNLPGVDRIQVLSSGTGMLRDKRFHAQRHKGVKAHNAVNPEGDACCPPDPAAEPNAPAAKTEDANAAELSESTDPAQQESAAATASADVSETATTESPAPQPQAESAAPAATGRKRRSSQS